MIRKIVKVGVAGTLALGAVAATQATAQASEAKPKVSFTLRSQVAQSPYRQLDISVDGVYSGSAIWSQDPGGDANGDGKEDPGDAIIAYDGSADGMGIEARLETGRIASTRGHGSPYWSPWATGNLGEGTAHSMKICLVKGDWESCSSWVTVYA
ncbi:hypothetical protein ACFZCY_28270 [Streptomyces sp. NPDC007983]|uniref:hypothetical protein n=1 Tax=Streptomyces sp. NPDC007983 TaxID=3364800 RepID=UPI0036E2C80B